MFAIFFVTGGRFCCHIPDYSISFYTVTAKSIKCDGYQIQVSNSKNFDSNSETVLTTLNYYGTSAKATFDNKMVNKTKYIRVRAFYKAGDSIAFGKWSNVKKLSK